MEEKKEIKSILKSANAYQEGNSKLVKGQNLLKFVQEYFDGRTPTMQEWEEFFVDILKCYSTGKESLPLVKIVDFLKEVDASSLTETPEDLLASFFWNERTIYMSQQLIAQITNRSYSILIGINSLFHEFRHFYQYSAELDENKELYQDILGKDYRNISRGVRMPVMGKREGVELICKLVHSATPKCKMIENILALDDRDRNSVYDLIAYGCYYYAPHEVDARGNADKRTEKLVKDLFYEGDEKFQDTILVDYATYQNKYENDNVKDLTNKYFTQFKSELQSLSNHTIEQIGNSCRMFDNEQVEWLYLTFVDLILGEYSEQEQKDVAYNCLVFSYPELFETLLDACNFSQKTLNELEKYILKFSKNGLLSEQMISKIGELEYFNSIENLKTLLLESVRFGKYSGGISVFRELYELDYNFQSEDFIDDVASILKENALEVLSSQVYTEKHINEGMKINNFLLQTMLQTRLTKEMGEEIRQIQEHLDCMINNANERG